MENNMPEKKFVAGAVSATIWKNERQKDGNEFVLYTIGIDRRYKDKDGAWKSTNGLGINDLPRASLVLQKAYEYLVLKGNAGIVEEII